MNSLLKYSIIFLGLLYHTFVKFPIKKVANFHDLLMREV